MTSSARVDCGGGVTLERGVACRMSDGVVLYADHYFPPQTGPQPTLLVRQPYGRDIASTVVYAHPVWFARHGYNVVIQDVRGRGDSEGEFYPFRYEARDGAETICAVRARPESNGRVGMYGFSYQGMTQLLAAAEQPEGLQCIAPAMAALDLYRGWFYHNGALRLASTMGWGLQMLKADARRLGLREASERLERAWANLAAQYQETPYAGHPAIRSEGLPTYVRDWIEHDAAGQFWSAMDVSEAVEKICVPALHVSGWYDTYLKGSVEGYLAMRAGAGTAHARENQYLLAGPWVHIPWSDRIGGTRASGLQTRLLDTDALHLRWFDHWLKDSGERRDREPAGAALCAEWGVNRWQASGRWHDAEEWPEFTEDAMLSSAAVGGRAKSSGRGMAVLGGESCRREMSGAGFVCLRSRGAGAPGRADLQSNCPGPFDQSRDRGLGTMCWCIRGSL